MNKSLIARQIYDHPEHFDDIIREYKSSNRYIPTPLEDLLFEQCGHRCTICSATLCEIHHIEFLQNGGKTEYDNLIVLCPNCHTRVHLENTPTPQQLKQYKLKLEIVYTLPNISRLTKEEKELVKELALIDTDQMIMNFSRRHCEEIPASNQQEAKRILRENIGFINLEFDDIIRVEYGLSVTLSSGESVSVELFIRPTSKAVK